MFDPEQYLAAKMAAQSTPAPGGFDPEAYLKAKGVTMLPAAPAPVAAPAPEIGMGEALLRGGVQGATLGFGDELAGGLQALSDVAFNRDKHLSDLVDLYRQHRDESRAAMDAASEQHPYASLIGNLVGGLAPAVLSGGASEVASGASMLEKAGAAAKLGAKAGAVMGLGGSNADLTKGDVLGAAKDTALGAAGGAAVGGVMSPAIDAVMPNIAEPAGKTFDWIKENTGPVGEGIKSLEQGVKGRQLFGNAGRDNLSDEIIKLQKNLDPELQSHLTDIMNQRDAALAKGSPVDIEKWYNKANAALDSLKANTGRQDVVDDIEEVKNTIDNWVKGWKTTLDVPTVETSAAGLGSTTKDGVQSVDTRMGGFGMQPSAAKAYGLKQELGNMGSAGQSPLQTGDVRNLINALVGGTSDYTGNTTAALADGAPALKTLVDKSTPGLSDINSTYHGLLNAKGDVPTLSEIMNLDSKGDSATRAKAAMDGFLNNLPDDVRGKFEPQIRDLAEANEIKRQIASTGVGHSLMGTARSIFLTGANATGLGINQIAKASPEAIRDLATRVLETHGQDGQGLANALGEISNRDEIGRNAMMFAIQQNAGYRKMLHGIAGTEDQK